VSSRTEVFYSPAHGAGALAAAIDDMLIDRAVSANVRAKALEEELRHERATIARLERRELLTRQRRKRK
jgi:hypothetical protein